MSLADDVRETLDRKFEPTPCKTAVWLDAQDDESQKAFAAWIGRGGLVSDLWRLCIRNGCDAAETSFRRHCRKSCSCYARGGSTD